jgi:antitoxin component YwqK of YwqJK toxin-antitoxin module
MKKAGEKYNNGQAVSEQKGDILTYYLKDGTVKARGKYIDGLMQGKWIFNKKEGYLWQIGHFDDQGKQHGLWVVYNQDGSVQKEKHFEHGKQIEK